VWCFRLPLPSRRPARGSAGRAGDAGQRTGGAFTDAARRFVDGFDGPCLEKPFPVERIEQLLCDLSAG
jgi:hypothetical protein